MVTSGDAARIKSESGYQELLTDPFRFSLVFSRRSAAAPYDGGDRGALPRLRGRLFSGFAQGETTRSSFTGVFFRKRSFIQRTAVGAVAFADWMCPHFPGFESHFHKGGQRKRDRGVGSRTINSGVPLNNPVALSVVKESSITGVNVFSNV